MLVELKLNFDVAVLQHYLNHDSNIIWPHVLLSFNANAFNIPSYDFVKKIIKFGPFYSLYIYFLPMLLKVGLGTWHFVGDANSYMAFAICKWHLHWH